MHTRTKTDIQYGRLRSSAQIISILSFDSFDTDGYWVTYSSGVHGLPSAIEINNRFDFPQRPIYILHPCIVFHRVARLEGVIQHHHGAIAMMATGGCHGALWYRFNGVERNSVPTSG